MKGIVSWIAGIALLVVILSMYEIKAISNIYIVTLWHNFKFISLAMYTIIPLLLLVGFLFLLFMNKWAFRVERLSIGGFNILFDNPNHLFRRQVKTFLDTKRTVFKTNLDRDNFKETLDSFFDVYKFFRDEIKVLGNVRKKKREISNETLELYNLSNETIMVLNDFLTVHQSNYRRWYIYSEKDDEKKFYLTPIGELQKEYQNYEELCSDFKVVNEFFVNKIAKKFDINIEKWGIENA